MEAGSKRKRDLECPRITYHAPERTFDRLFREDSLAQLKQVARTKLGLRDDAVIDLSQIRGDTYIDLEDEDDFDAFYNAVHSSSTASIRVTIRKGVAVKSAKEKEPRQSPESKKRKLDGASQPSVADAPLTSTPGPISRKRAVSIAQPGASKHSEAQTVEPPAKRAKTVSTSLSKQPITLAQQPARSIDTPAPPPVESSKQSDTLDKATATSKTAPGPPLKVVASVSISSPTAPVTDKGKAGPKVAPKPATKVAASSASSTTPAPPPNASIPAAKPGVDGNNSAKSVSEQVADVPAIQEPLSYLGDGTLESQGEARGKEKVKVKVTKEKKPKNKSKVKPKDAEGGKESSPLAETVQEPATLETSKTTAATAQPPQAKETISNAPAGQKDTKSKSKKAKSITPKDPPDAGVTEKTKRKATSKSKVRESSSAVDLETNNAVTPDSQVEASNISAISRSIIEKYMTPSSPSSVVDAEDTAVQLVSAIQASHNTTVKVTAFSRPTCPYCGKRLTHDRSHCPLIRAKLPETIERRIAELNKDTSADPGGVRAEAIKVLELAVQRKRGGETKKGKDSNVPPSEHTSLTVVSAPTKTPTTTSSAQKPSSSSSDNSSNDSVPLKTTSSSHLSARRKSPPPQGVNTSHPSGADKSSLVVPSHQSEPSLTRTAEKDVSSSFREDRSESESSSEDEAPQPQPTAKPAPTKPVPPPPQNSDSESSNSSSDDESTTAPLRQPQPEPQPSLLPLANPSNYSDKDLEALIRGPGIPLKLTELPSSESSEGEEPDDVQLDNESEQEPASRTRKAPRFYAPSNNSSDEGGDENDDNEDSDAFRTPSAYTSAPPPVARAGPTEDGGRSHPILGPSQNNKLFQRMGGRQSSVESDQGGNKAFEEALAQENAVFELARELTSLPPVEGSSGPAIVTQHPTDNPGADEPSKTDIDQERGPEKAESNNTDPGKGATPEGIVEEEPELVQVLEPGHAEALETPEDDVTGTPALLSPTEADGEAPSTPLPPSPEQPREEPTRASTPKPETLRRLRNRVGVVPPVKNQPSRSSLVVTPVAKASLTRAATLRSQQKLKTRSQSTGSSQQAENDTDTNDTTPGPVAGKPVSKRGAATASVSKPVPTRPKVAAEKNLERVQEDQEVPNPPPRRSTRTASKTAGTSTPTAPAAPMPLPPSKRTRQVKPLPAAEENKDSSQLRSRKGSQQKKGAPKATAKSPTPPLTTEDDNVETFSSQSVQPQEDVTLPPSPPVSLDTWETLQTETPVGTTQSDPMVDELQSDMDPIPFPLKPQYQRKTPTFGRKRSLSRFEQAVHDANHSEKAKEKAKNSPLFMPSDSQSTFPHSQFQTPAAVPVATDSSDSEAEVRNSVMKKQAPSQSQPSRYRKLTDIASEASVLFTPTVLGRLPGLIRPAASVPTKRQDRLSQMYGKMGKKSEVEESSDESGQSSESETEKVSHIPKSRKAGAGLKRRMSLA